MDADHVRISWRREKSTFARIRTARPQRSGYIDHATQAPTNESVSLYSCIIDSYVISGCYKTMTIMVLGCDVVWSHGSLADVSTANAIYH